MVVMAIQHKFNRYTAAKKLLLEQPKDWQKLSDVTST